MTDDPSMFIERGTDYAVSRACDGVKLTHTATGSVLIIPSGMEATIPLSGMWTVGQGPARETAHTVTLDGQQRSLMRLPLASVEQLAVQGEVPEHWLAGARRAHAKRMNR